MRHSTGSRPGSRIWRLAVRTFESASRQITEGTRAVYTEPDSVTGSQFRLLNPNVVEVGPIRRREILDQRPTLGIDPHPGMLPGDLGVVEYDLVLRRLAPDPKSIGTDDE